MQLSPQNYTDFVSVVRSMRGFEVLFYYDDTSTNNRAMFYSIHADGWIVMLSLTGISSLPTSFSSDFPDAVQVSSGL